MPCSDGGYDDFLKKEAHLKEVAELKAIAKSALRDLDRVTRMLCELCAEVQHFTDHVPCDEHIHLPLDVMTWWEKHKQVDAARIARENNPNWKVG